jgi:hypothetical protein
VPSILRAAVRRNDATRSGSRLHLAGPRGLSSLSKQDWQNEAKKINLSKGHRRTTVASVAHPQQLVVFVLGSPVFIVGRGLAVVPDFAVVFWREARMFGP